VGAGVREQGVEDTDSTLHQLQVGRQPGYHQAGAAAHAQNDESCLPRSINGGVPLARRILLQSVPAGEARRPHPGVLWLPRPRLRRRVSGGAQERWVSGGHLSASDKD